MTDNTNDYCRSQRDLVSTMLRTSAEQENEDGVARGRTTVLFTYLPDEKKRFMMTKDRFHEWRKRDDPHGTYDKRFRSLFITDDGFRYKLIYHTFSYKFITKNTRLCSNSDIAKAIGDKFIANDRTVFIEFVPVKNDEEWVQWNARCRVKCGASDCTETGLLLKCSGCNVALYCSNKCYKKHWKNGHKEQCGKELD